MSNLIRKDDRTPEERRSMTSKAGKASGEARRRKKAFKQILNAMLETPVTGKETGVLASLGIPEDQANQKALVMAALLIQAKAGDVVAIREIQRITGEDVTERLKQDRLKLDREIFEHQKKSLSPNFEEINAQNQAIADLINYPQQSPPRRIEDFMTIEKE
jgi:hypothetical protein